jgi:hypothetical protein
VAETWFVLALAGKNARNGTTSSSASSGAAPSVTNVADEESKMLHPWAGSLVLINIVNGRNTGHKKLLLRVSIVRKLTLDESKLVEQPTLYVAPHHWPISLHRLASPSQTTLLSLNLAKTIQDTDGHSHLTDPLYQASSLAKKYKISVSSNDDLNKFKQTPVSEHAEVESVYESLFNNRSERLASRRSVNITPAAPQRSETAMSRDYHDSSLCSRPPEAEISKNSFDTASLPLTSNTCSYETPLKSAPCSTTSQASSLLPLAS